MLGFAPAGARPAAGAQVRGIDGDRQSGSINVRGAPVITGGHAVWKESPVGRSLLTMTLNFGELSPINTNPVVRISVPLTIDVNRNYQVALSVDDPGISDPNAVQLSDIGVGVQNLRLLGAGDCPGVIRPPFNNDPSLALTLNPSTGRAGYPTSLEDLISRPVIIRGPRLRRAGAAFDLIFAAAPAFYTPGNVSFTVTVWLLSGPNFDC